VISKQGYVKKYVNPLPLSDTVRKQKIF